MKSVLTIIGDTLQKHCIVILIGIAMALIVTAPHLRAVTSMGIENFQGVYPLFSDDEVTYLARIKEVVDGHMAISNPYIREHMDDSFIMPPFAEWIFASLSLITGTSVPFIMSVSDGVLGFVCFILIYVLFHAITRSVWISLLYALIFFFFSLGTFGRPISPQFNALFLFVGLTVISKVYFSAGLGERKWNLIAGFITGITCFISPYFFTALLGLYVLIFAMRSIMERSIDIVRKNAPWFFLAFLPWALVYAFLQLNAAQDPSYSETVLRYGLMHTHIPGSFTNMFFGGIACVVLLLCFRSLHQQKFAFALGSIVTLFALNWQNILTGKSLQFSSHYLFTSILLIFIVLALIHTALVSSEMVNMRRLRRSFIMGGIVFLVAIIGYNQKDEFIHLGNIPFTHEALLHEQKKMDVFNWLNKHTAPDSVVYALGDQYDFLLPVYTHSKVFYNFYAALYPAFDTETEERWIIQHMFEGGMSTSSIEAYQREYWGNRYIDIYQSSENRKKIYSFITGTPYIPAPMIPSEKIEYMYHRWLDITTRSIEENLSRYEIDYILVSPEYSHYKQVMEQLEEIKSVSFVTDVGGVRIYTHNSKK